MSENGRRCLAMVQRLKKHKCADPFLFPVDPIAQGVPDYPKIIKKPMDLGTVEKNLRAGLYANSSHLASDIRLIWSNAIRYNPKDSEIYLMTVDLSQYFEETFASLENLPLFDSSNPYSYTENPNGQSMGVPGAIKGGNNGMYEMQAAPVKKKSKNSGRGSALTGSSRGGQDRSKAKPKSSSASWNGGNINGILFKIHALTKIAETDKREMTFEEKKNLVNNIRVLPAENLRGVWEIVSEGNPAMRNKGELEFDIDTLPIYKARQLEKYVKSKLNAQKKKKVKPPSKAPASYRKNLPLENPKALEMPSSSFPMNNSTDQNFHRNMSLGEDNMNKNMSQMSLGSRHIGESQQKIHEEPKSSDSSFMTESNDSDSNDNSHMKE